MDKNSDLKNFKAPKHEEKLDAFTFCFFAIVIMISIAALKQSWDEGIERVVDNITIHSSCGHDHEYH